MKDTKVAWFSTYTKVEPEAYEHWLEEEALQGWHVEKVGQWSSICMVFRRGEPKRYRYVYDLQAAARRDYRTLYEQFGWELVGQMSSIYLWRKEYDTQRPESFSDTESLRRRNLRVMVALIIALCFFIPVLPLALTLIFLHHAQMSLEQWLEAMFGLVLALGLIACIASALRRVYKSTRR